VWGNLGKEPGHSCTDAMSLIGSDGTAESEHRDKVVGTALLARYQAAYHNCFLCLTAEAPDLRKQAGIWGSVLG